MRTLSILTLLLLFTFNLSAQVKATTSDGKEVILNSDGTWQYVDEAKTQDNQSEINYSCSDLISVTTDKVSGITSTGSKETLVISEDGGKTGFGIYLLKTKKLISFNVVAVGAGNCIDEGDTANILFRDGSRLEIKNDSEFNCEKRYTYYMGGVFSRKKQIEALSTKQIEILRVWTSDGYVEESFTIDQSEQLRKVFECLSSMP